MALFNFPEWKKDYIGGDQAGRFWRLMNGPEEYIVCYQLREINIRYVYWINSKDGVTLDQGDIPSTEIPERYTIKKLEECISKNNP